MGRTRRLAAALGVAVLALAGCGGATTSPAATATSGSSVPTDARLLASGLAANLDKLASYRFSEIVYSSWNGSIAPIVPVPAAPSGSNAIASAGASAPTGFLRIDGTIVNGADGPSIRLDLRGVEYVIVGKKAWISVDGTLWAESDELADVTSQLPASYYKIWFDKHVGGFAAVDASDHNGIRATHFSGGDSLANLYATRGGASFQADLWIAVEGSYPLGGRYLFPTGTSVSGYSFEITGVNDPANAVSAPENVIPLPS